MQNKRKKNYKVKFSIIPILKDKKKLKKNHNKIQYLKGKKKEVKHCDIHCKGCS